MSNKRQSIMENTVKYNSIAAAAAVLFLATTVSCKKTDVGYGDNTTNEPGRIEILTSINALTKAPVLDENGKGNFSDGDIFTVAVSGSGFPYITENYTTGSPGLLWSDLNLPEETVDVYFSGCYPVREPAADGTFTFTVSPENETDLLLAPAVKVRKNTGTAVTLAFRHALHKLAVEYVPDGLTDGQLTQISTSFKALSSCSVDQAKGTILENTASGLSEVGTRQGRQVSCLIIPQEKDNITLEVSLDGTVQSLGIPDYTQDGSPVGMLEGGKCLTVRVKVSAGKISLDGVQIVGWEEQGTVDGELEL